METGIIREWGKRREEELAINSVVIQEGDGQNVEVKKLSLY